tara:strand:+ start:1969 stop:2427 length:459 start_codon:yes stop_codon:yes gene_type:complete
MSRLRFSVQVARELHNRGIYDTIFKSKIIPKILDPIRGLVPKRDSVLVSGVHREYDDVDRHYFQWGTEDRGNKRFDFITFSYNGNGTHFSLVKNATSDRFERIEYHGIINEEKQRIIDHLISLPAKDAIRLAIKEYFNNTFQPTKREYAKQG